VSSGLEVGRQLRAIWQEVGRDDDQLGASAVEGLQRLARSLGEAVSLVVALFCPITVQRELALDDGDYARPAVAVFERLRTWCKVEDLLDDGVAELLLPGLRRLESRQEAA
jgi:hypothetical protein